MTGMPGWLIDDAAAAVFPASPLLDPHTLVPRCQGNGMLYPLCVPPIHPTHHHPTTYPDGRAAKGMNADAGDATSMAAQATTTEVIFPIAWICVCYGCRPKRGWGRENGNVRIKPSFHDVQARVAVVWLS